MFRARQNKTFLFKSQDNWFLHLDKYVPHPGAGGEGGRALPSNRLMGMCRWMGSHFYHWIDIYEHFRTTLIEGFIRYMHKQKKTLEYDEIDLIFSVFT